MKANELEWSTGIPGVWNNTHDVHVWRVFLDLPSHESDSLAAILSADEMARARRFHFEKDQKRYIVARGILRKILGRYLGTNPHELRFVYTSRGKPLLASAANKDNLVFNLSHSEAFALCAVTRGSNIGIDMERVREDVAFESIAQRFFSQAEMMQLEKLPNNERPGLFFQYWTRKEAILKATGEGISFPLELCDVSAVGGGDFTPVRLPGSNEDNAVWYTQDLSPGSGYVAAIAVQQGDARLSCLDYSL